MVEIKLGEEFQRMSPIEDFWLHFFNPFSFKFYFATKKKSFHFSFKKCIGCVFNTIKLFFATKFVKCKVKIGYIILKNYITQYYILFLAYFDLK